MKHDRKHRREDPYHSEQEVAERIAFEKRNFWIKIGLVAAIPIGLALLYFLFDYATNVGD